MTISLWWPWSSGIISPWAQNHTEPMTKGHSARKLGLSQQDVPPTRAVPKLKLRIIKAQVSWGTFNTVRNTGMRLPAYHKQGVSALTKSHATASFNRSLCTAKPSKTLGVHEVPDTQRYQLSVQAGSTFQEKGERKSIKDTSADLLFENESEGEKHK